MSSLGTGDFYRVDTRLTLATGTAVAQPKAARRAGVLERPEIAFRDFDAVQASFVQALGELLFQERAVGVAKRCDIGLARVDRRTAQRRLGQGGEGR